MKDCRAVQLVRIIWLVLLLAQGLCLGGCWNYRDLTDLNIVSAIGVELTEEEKVLVTVQVVEQGGAGAGGSVRGQSQGLDTFVQSSEAETVFEALRGMLSLVDKKLFTSTAQVLILGEKLSRQGLQEIMDFFQRDHEIGYRMDVLVAKDTSPRELLEMKTDIDPISGLYIQGTIENNVSRGTAKRTLLIDLLKELQGDREIAVGQVSKAGEQRVRTEGTAVFKDAKMVGQLDPTETRGYLFAIDRINNPTITVPVHDGVIALEVKRSKGRLGVEFSAGQPVLLTVDVKVEAYVGEQKGNTGNTGLDLLETLLNEEIADEIRLALTKAQQDYASDIFGFGAHIHKYRPRDWARLKDNWNDLFSQLPAEIRVVSKISRTGNVIL